MKNKQNDAAFLGTGWGFPPTFSRLDHAVVMVSGEHDIEESLWVLFETAMGSRIMLPTYGCDLMARVFSGMTTAFKTKLVNDITSAIIEWEPRIIVNNVQIAEQDAVEGVIKILVDYTVRMTNARGNYVYPFYLLEATLPKARS
jgi:hypothetical protein